ncbi:DUF2784 domain-containing protein [Nocardia callitridis]|uniref:DUF2784 domain-containing protein n=1 Tax=Nocardia callitridis TaxID=648753 RepID=A0ABP9K4U6_9NOCA
MFFQALADLVAAVHFAFIGYVVVGGFLAWHWTRTIWPHVIAVAWGFGTVLYPVGCPLTFLENWARDSAGTEGLPPGGFIDNYITGVFYPDSALGLVRALVIVGVAVSWVGYVRLQRHRAAGPVSGSALPH